MEDPFKRPTTFSNKRKVPPQAGSNGILKSAKHTPNGDVKGYEHTINSFSEDDDEAAGPERPPDEDEEAPELDDDDEEGRFFGGGVSEDTTQAMDYIEEHDKGEDVAPEIIDSAWLRKLSLNFERRISKNAELRAKYEDEPQKFMGSEADLDADIKTLSTLSEHPELYEEFAKPGCVGSLVSLLAHDNTDIAIDAIEILAELTDQDVQAKPEQLDALVEGAFEADLLNLLVQNFERLDESNESDRNGVYHSLSLFENLASQAKTADKLAEDAVLRWLVTRLQRKEKVVTQNKQYTAEVLAITLQVSAKARDVAMTLDVLNVCLQLLSSYRKRDPDKNSDEEEYAENVFDALTSLVETDAGKQAFVEAEGVELCLIMLKEGKFSKPRALRILDHATSGKAGIEVCMKLVDAAGLKPLFSVFMKSFERESTEHVLGIFASMLRLLPGDSAQRIRLLAKFMEKDYEKIQRLSKLRQGYGSRLAEVDQAIAAERSSLASAEQDEQEDEWLSRRLDAGLFSFQTVDVILAWLAAEDQSTKQKIVDLLKDQKRSIHDIAKSLTEQLEDLNQSEATTESSDIKDTTEMLETLVEFIR